MTQPRYFLVEMPAETILSIITFAVAGLSLYGHGLMGKALLCLTVFCGLSCGLYALPLVTTEEVLALFACGFSLVVAMTRVIFAIV